LAGTRFHSSNGENTKLESSKLLFEKRVSELLEELEIPKEEAQYFGECPPIRSLRFCDKSLDLYTAFNNEIEKELGIGGIYHPVKAFAAKIAEQSLRIAGVFTLFEDSDAETIEEEIYEKSVGLSRWYLQEVVKISRNDMVEDITRHHQEVLNILKSRYLREKGGLTIRDIIHRCVTKPIRNKKRVLSILENLEKMDKVHYVQGRWKYAGNEARLPKNTISKEVQ